MGIIVMVAYRPKAGKLEQLEELAKQHHAILRHENLVTNRTPIIARANDDSVIEIFEWTSETAIQDAHSNLAVAALWSKFHDACDYVPIADLAEAGELFSAFTPLN